jgi:hypothetical protein
VVARHLTSLDPFGSRHLQTHDGTATTARKCCIDYIKMGLPTKLVLRLYKLSIIHIKLTFTEKYSNFWQKRVNNNNNNNKWI